MTKKKPSPWRKLADSGEIGQEYPAIVDSQEEVVMPSQEEMIAYMNREVPQAPEGAFEPLPQEVKSPWAAIEQDPAIFNQVRNTIRRRMWNQ